MKTIIPNLEQMKLGKLDLSGCTDFTELRVPEEFNHVYLLGCTGLTHLSLPRSVKILDLRGCTALRFMKIGAVTFQILKGKPPTFPKTVQPLDLGGLAGLAVITLRQGVESIAVSNCKSPMQLQLFSSVKHVYLKECAGLTLYCTGSRIKL